MLWMLCFLSIETILLWPISCLSMKNMLPLWTEPISHHSARLMLSLMASSLPLSIIGSSL